MHARVHAQSWKNNIITIYNYIVHETIIIIARCTCRYFFTKIQYKTCTHVVSNWVTQKRWARKEEETIKVKWVWSVYTVIHDSVCNTYIIQDETDCVDSDDDIHIIYIYIYIYIYYVHETSDGEEVEGGQNPLYTDSQQ